MESKQMNRLQRLVGQVQPQAKAMPRMAMPFTVSATADNKETLTITDNRTGKTYTIPINMNMINAPDLMQIRLAPGAEPLRSYDPGLKNTGNATSRITYIDGNKGILEYRGIPIEQLAEKSTFLEVSYLLIYGSLPARSELDYFTERVMRHTYIHQDLKQMMKSFRFNSHPMGMLISTVSAMSTFHPEGNPALVGQDVYKDDTVRNKHMHRMLGTIPTIAANAYRHRIGRPYNDPSTDPAMGYTENFMYMLDKLGNDSYRPHPRLARALDILFILHADHELNCSTSAMRHLASSGVDVYTCVAGSAAALYGPRHGGANEAVLRMLEKIGDKSNIPKFVESVKARKVRLMGFGHRVYRNYDPRARIIKKIAEEVFSILGREPLIEVAVALEKIALEDPFFKQRKLYPNVDFYSGLIYKAMGFPTDFFPVLFTIPRTAGWLAHWSEFNDDPENVIIRPRQKYVGARELNYVPIEARRAATTKPIQSGISSESKRRSASGTRA